MMQGICLLCLFSQKIRLSGISILEEIVFLKKISVLVSSLLLLKLNFLLVAHVLPISCGKYLIELTVLVKIYLIENLTLLVLITDLNLIKVVLSSKG